MATDLKHGVPSMSPGEVRASVNALYPVEEENDVSNPSGAPGMVDRSWVKANTVPIGTTTISFRCR